jgi:hypothetical protein
MYQAEAVEPLPGVKPYPALELAGRDVYMREGCYNCHSQMVRTLRFETERYGHYSLAGESVYDRPFQWGSKRTGPGSGPRRRPLFGRLASRAPEQPARCGAGIEHAGLPVAGRCAGRRRWSRRRCGAANPWRPLHRCRDRRCGGSGAGQDRTRCGGPTCLSPRLGRVGQAESAP